MPEAIDITNVKKQVLTKTWQYLLENFHKMSESNKIKVALALSLKDMPTQLEGGLTFNKMPAVIVNGSKLELDIGQLSSPGDAESPGQTTPADNTDQQV